ncbi:MAG: flagellar basal body P-ring formation chaperone FlgA [Bacillota bacterium]
MKARLIVFGILLLLIVVAPVTLAQENSIIIPSQVGVESLQVKLTEIAELKGSDEFINQLQDLTLGQTPHPGYQRVVYRDDLVYALQQKNIDLNTINFNVPYQFTVQADYNKLSVDKLIDYGKEQISKELNYKQEKLEIEALNAPEEVLVPQGEIEFEIKDNPSRRLLGVSMLGIKIMVDGQRYRQFHIKFKTEVWREVLLANENLEKGQKLSSDLFTREEKLIDDQREKIVSGEEELSKKILKRSLGAQEILTYDLLETPSLVKRWQEVKIIAKVGGIVVSTAGKALETGHEGDIIKVKNVNSSQKIEAKVVDSNEVEAVIN